MPEPRPEDLFQVMHANVTQHVREYFTDICSVFMSDFPRDYHGTVLALT